MIFDSFLIKKPVNPTKGGFLSTVSAKLNKVTGEMKETQKEPVQEKLKEKPKEEKRITTYEKWFYKNWDNNNLPYLSEIISHDYV